MANAEIIRSLQHTNGKVDVVEIKEDGIKHPALGIVGHFEAVDWRFVLRPVRLRHGNIDNIVYT